MGLDTTHDAWHGPYGAFSRWRSELVRAAGYQVVPTTTADGWPTDDYPDLPGWDDDLTLAEVSGTWKRKMPDPLIYLIWHSDCDGRLLAAQMRPLADRLEELLPKLDDESGYLSMRKRTQQFIDGLRLAISEKKPLGFH
jgi:hypothetical protein